MTGGRRPRERGGLAEEWAESFLMTRGYFPLARNFHSRGGEVDLIVGRDDLLAFVEVKLRKPGAVVDAQESVTPTKQRRIIRAAFEYVEKHRLEDRGMRFDIVAVTLGAGRRRKPVFEHLEAAFDTSALIDQQDRTGRG